MQQVVEDDPASSDGARRPVERVASVATPKSTGTPVLLHDGDGLDRAYRVTYRVATPSSVSVEVWTVRLPFDARVVVHDGDGADDAVIETREQSIGVYATKREPEDAVVLAPAPSAVNYRPGPIVEDAVGAGVLVPREKRVVAKRPCQVYRTGTEAGGATFTAPGPGDDEHIDVCVDEDGLLLELLEVFGGRVLRQRVALEVEPDVDVEDRDLARLPSEQTVPAAKGGGSLRETDPASQPIGPFLLLDAPPAGFALSGRFEVIPPQPAIAQEETRGSVVAATSDIYVRGDDVLVVERGARLDKGPAWVEDDRYPKVSVGGAAVPSAELLAGTNGGELRALLGSGRFVRVYGTVGLDELQSVMAALREVDGGTGPRYL